MVDNIEELEKRLEHIEQTASKEELENKLAQEMKDYRGPDEVISFKDVKESEIKVEHYSCGLGVLDKMLQGGFEDGDLVVITGPTGQGKTLLLQTFTINLSKKGIKSLWFSYEVTVQSLIQKFGNELPDGYIPKVLRETSIVWIERKIVEGIKKFGIKAVFLDPFNSLTRFSSNRLSQELGDLSEQIKQIALKYNILFFVSAHARRLNQEEKTYSEETIRDTALLGNKANTIIALWRDKLSQGKKEEAQNGNIYTNGATLSLVKNRNSGVLGFVKVVHAGNKFLVADYGLQNIQEEQKYDSNY